MDDSAQPLRIKLTNHLTGEITEVDVTNSDQAKNLYLEISASASVIKKAQDMLRNYLDTFLGQDDKYDFIDGHYIRRVQRTSLVYRPEVVKKYLQSSLDKDTFHAAWDAIIKIDQPAADELVGEMMERGELPAGTLKKIRDEADMKSTKPYVEVR